MRENDKEGRNERERKENVGNKERKKGRRGERSERDRKITREEKNILESNKKVWVGKEVMKN